MGFNNKSVIKFAINMKTTTSTKGPRLKPGVEAKMRAWLKKLERATREKWFGEIRELLGEYYEHDNWNWEHLPSVEDTEEANTLILRAQDMSRQDQ